jgi:hypothetical protein
VGEVHLPGGGERGELVGADLAHPSGGVVGEERQRDEEEQEGDGGHGCGSARLGTLLRRGFTSAKKGTFGAPATRGFDVLEGVLRGDAKGSARVLLSHAHHAPGAG